MRYPIILGPYEGPLILGNSQISVLESSRNDIDEQRVGMGTEGIVYSLLRSLGASFAATTAFAFLSWESK